MPRLGEYYLTVDIYNNVFGFLDNNVLDLHIHNVDLKQYYPENQNIISTATYYKHLTQTADKLRSCTTNITVITNKISSLE